MMQKLTRLNEGFYIYKDCINVGVIVRNGKAILIDCGDGGVIPLLPDIGVTKIDWILFTHYHSDQASGIECFSDYKPAIAVSGKEEHLFTNVEDFWSSPDSNYYRYTHLHPDRLVLRNSVAVDLAVKDGQEIEWEGIKIKVVASPGHTEGSVSYLISWNENTVTFIGDLLYDTGKLYELYSLQKGIMGLTDYHAFGGGIDETISSLKKLLDNNPGVFVPSHGNAMLNPQNAVRAYEANIKQFMHHYLEFSSLRHWFGDKFEYLGDVLGPVKSAPITTLPSWIRESNWPARALVAEDGSIFVIDCGDEEVISWIDSMKSDDALKVDGIWITHYHFDHMEYVNKLKEKYNCRIFAHEKMADILENPERYCLPCLSKQKLSVDCVVAENQELEWKGFHLKAYYLPGQTIYDAGLLVEYKGKRVFFIGDSFTPCGIDDYCMYNRNILGKGVGYDYCIDLLKSVSADMLINQHQYGGFVLTDDVLDAIKVSLTQRIKDLKEILPWDDPNYGLDPGWVQCYPYEQHSEPGQKVKVDVKIQNYSSVPKQAKVSIRTPDVWDLNCKEEVFDIEAHKAGSAAFYLSIPKDMKKGMNVLGALITYDEHFLAEIAHAVVYVV